MFCAQCGHAHPPASQYCIGCGRILTADGAIPAGHSSSSTLDANALYQRTFIGSHADYYLEKWQRIGSAQNVRSWNNAACFFNVFWLAYRKMYRQACIFTAIMLGTTAAEIVLKISAGPLDLFINLICALVCGYWGNYWYQKHTERKIAELKGSGFQEKELLLTMSQAGGTTLLASLGLALFFVSFSIVYLSIFGSVLWEAINSLYSVLIRWSSITE